MNNWIPKNKTFRLTIVLATLSVVLYFVGLLIVSMGAKKIENFYSNTESETFKEQKFWTVKSIAEANADAIKSVKNFYVKKGDEVIFIEQIEDIAKKSGVKSEIVSINIKPDQTDSFKEDVDLNMKISGTWNEVMFFINKLEKMSFGVLINKINLDADEPSQWNGFVEFTIFKEK